MFPVGPVCDTPLKLAEHFERGLPPAEARPLYAAPAVCIEPQSLAKQEQVDGTFDQTRTTEHFYLAWDASNAVLDGATIDLVENALEKSWTVEVDQAGWKAPDETDSCLITVVLADLTGSSSGTGGWTNVNAEHGVPFMVINTDWFSDGDAWIESLMAHEFNHASQFAYNVFWNPSDWWYWESTAEWSFELPFPEANAWTYSLWSYLDRPHLALDSQVALVNYGHFTFNVYLTEQVDPEAPLLAWRAATAKSSAPDAIEEATGLGMDEMVGEFTAHVAAFDFAEREVWEEVVSEFGVDPYLVHVEDYPAEGEAEENREPQGRGQNFLHFAGEPGDVVNFHFNGESEYDGAETNWAVTLSTVKKSGEVSHEVFATEGGKVIVPIEGLGDEISEAFVGVVPLNDIGEKGVSYTWRAIPSLQDPEACGCGTGGNAQSLAALAAIAALWRRQR